ncbi:MAG: hypothetical protein COA83_09725 [Methylophaga sp.]|nr:MAG: hypothetical protein COA83_09725 [Methylophaga sp.]
MASAVEILLKAKDFASDKIDKLKKRIKSLGAVSGASSVGTNRLSASVGGLTAKIGAFIGATAGFIAVKGLFEGVINTGAKFETLNTQLAAVTGSAEAGEEAFAWIKEFTKETPFQLDQVSESFIKLKAFGLDPMDGTMQKLVDTAAKLGGGQEKLNGIILAVGQAWAKQKLQAEETLQLVERGVPVYELLSKALGKTTAEIQEMSSKGELGRDAIKALIDALGDDALGAAAAEMKNFRGIVSNLKDTFVEFLAEVSDQGALDFFKGQLSDLADTIKRMREDGSLTELAKDISNFMIGAAEATKSLLGVMKSVIGKVIQFSSEIKNLALAFIAVKLAGFTAGIVTMISALTKATVAQKALNVVMKANPIGILITLTGGLFIAIEKLVDKYFEWSDGAEQAARAQYQAEEAAEASRKKFLELSELAGIQIQNEADLKKAIEDGIIVLDKKTEQYTKIKTAAELAALAENRYVSTLEGVNAGVDEQVKKMAEGSVAAQALVAKLDEMTEASGGLGQALSKLSNDELQNLSAKLNDAISDGFIDKTKAATIESGLLAENMRRLGIDATLVETGITSAGTAAISQFNAMNESAKLTDAQFKAGLIATLGKLKTQKAFDALTRDLKNMGDAGARTSDQVAFGLSQIKTEAENLEGALNDVDEAAKQGAESLKTMLSAVSSADTLSQVDDLANALGTAFDNGEISADEYSKALDRVLAKQAEITENLKKQGQEQDKVNESGKDRGTVERLEEENEMRSFALEITERQGKALFKAQQQIRESLLATASQKVPLEQYNSMVADVQENFVKASQSADEFAHKILDITHNGRASEQQMQSYIKSLNGAIKGGEDLDDQALSNLQAALSAAKSKMQALKSETQSTASEVAGLEAELAGLNGDDSRVQQLQNQQKRLDIERKIQKAQQDGNNDAVSNLKKSLALLGQINSKKQAQIRKDKANNTGGSTNNSSQVSPEKTVKLMFESPLGKQVTANVNDRDADNLINILKQSGAVTR